ncbi:hypothetical protein ACWDFH_23980 [Streptomyces kronopolitis]
MPQVFLEMTEHDWQRLYDVAYRFAGGLYERRPDLFENYTNREAEQENREPRWDWAWAYDVGRSWSSVMLARAYLQSIGEGCEVVWYMVDNLEPTYLVLCNVVPRGFEKKAEQQDG